MSWRQMTAFVVLAAAPIAHGQQIDVSTVPPRDTVQLTIYNQVDLTLVRETRHVTFAPGVNPLQFSWAGTLIDPSSVELRILTHDAELDVLDTTFPHDRPQTLFWTIDSAIDGAAQVEISYFTSGISWAADYVGTVDQNGEQMALEGFVRILNNSGEDYEDAEMRLVVGEISLVETIQDLARRGIISADNGVDDMTSSWRDSDEGRDAVGGYLRSETASAGERRIVKEGLSEYFIFTIEGTDTIPHSWSRRRRLFAGTDTPFRLAYRYRPEQYGHQLVRIVLLRNDTESHLGESPLPDGMVRVFREHEHKKGQDGLSFLTSHHTSYVPIGQEIEISLGPDPEVRHERLALRHWRDDIWFRDRDGKTYESLDGRQVTRDNDAVAGWNDHARCAERIHNTRDVPIEVEIRLALNGDVTFHSALDPVLHDFRSPQFTVTIPPRTKRDLAYVIETRQGINASQSSVTLESDR